MCDNYCNISDFVSNVTGYSDVIARPIIYFPGYFCCIAEIYLWVDMKRELNLQHILRINTQLYKFPLFCISSDTYDCVAVII